MSTALPFNKLNRPFSANVCCAHCGVGLEDTNGRMARGLVANQDGWFCSEYCHRAKLVKADTDRMIQSTIRIVKIVGMAAFIALVIILTWRPL